MFKCTQTILLIILTIFSEREEHQLMTNTFLFWEISMSRSMMLDSSLQSFLTIHFSRGTINKWLRNKEYSTSENPSVSSKLFICNTKPWVCVAYVSNITTFYLQFYQTIISSVCLRRRTAPHYFVERAFVVWLSHVLWLVVIRIENNSYGRKRGRPSTVVGF